MTKKIIAIFSSVLLILGASAPVFAESISITGNGSDSVNNANVTISQTTQVSQSNSANINNNVNSSSTTGDNSVSHNTGGNASVDTGNAKTQVSVANTANSNVANVDSCNCGTGNADVKVSGNGDGSVNVANTDLSSQVQLTQTNAANIDNHVKADSSSGKNDANHNTGGSVSVSTGNATTAVDLMTNANQNLAQVGSSTPGNGSTVSALITGNGSDSYNKINLGLTDWVVLGQSNAADVNNSVYAKSNTGKNDANYNTGGDFLGDASIQTGNATTSVVADTAVNFNQANVGCDCLVDVTAKIAGNGASDWWHKTLNTINADLTNGQLVGQTNGGEGIDNNLLGDSASGKNDLKSNTGSTTDPSVMTGDSWSATNVQNTGNANIYGATGTPIPFPWNGGNTNVTLTFSLQDLLIALGIH